VDRDRHRRDAAARTAVVGDTALSTEVETRAVGTESTVTTTVTGDTYQTQGTVAITATRALDEAGTFDQLAVGGNMGLSRPTT
jgi:ribosomal protein S25